MRQLLFAVLGLGLLVLAAAPAFAGEVCEGDGYKVRIPDGFTEAMSMSGTGNMKIKSNLGMLPIDGVPETTVYVAGDMIDPRGSVIVARVNIKSGHEIEDLDDLGLKEIEAMRARMPEGFEMNVRKIGKYDAIEMKMSMEMMDEEMTMRMISVAGGDFVFVVMLQTTDGHFPAADSMWETMLGSLQLSSRTNKLLLYGGLGFGALIVLVLLTKLAGGGGKSRYPEARDLRRTPRTHGRPGQQLPQTAPSRVPHSAPMPHRPTPAGGRPHVAPTTGRPGLRPTLPPSGQWGNDTPN